MKLVVFTAVVGPKTDRLRPVRAVHGVRYLCFTNQPISPDGWDVHTLPPYSTTHVHRARELKICAHESLKDFDADASLWMDAAYELLVDPRGIADEFLWRTDVAAFPHPDRQTVQAEGTAIIRLGKVSRPLIEQQLAAHSDLDARLTHPLTSTGFLLRRHCPRVQQFNRTWWRLFEQGGHSRDQMTMDWAAVSSQTDVQHLPGHYRENPFAKWHHR